MNYDPKPIDTSKVKLTKEILKLTEILAENAHDNWAKKRVSKGWTYGPKRVAKKHPDLVPYKDLPESEKELDRTAAMETLKALIAMGYKIEKKR